jgi:2-oxo-4-hydroxy-4-carboxy-5-ureidoimidazoline decarboxylase
MSEDLSLAGFNLAEPAVAQQRLLECCASRRWAGEVLARRPYPDLAALRSVAAAVLDRLSWSDVEEALGAHPRIGERAAGDGQEATWSREEQSGAGAELAEDLFAGNVAYEERFGHVFLICATGLSGEAMLTALRERLGNDPETERAVVRAELGKILDLRLGKAFGS